MTAAPKIYSPFLELVAAWLLGILGFLVGFIVVWAIHSVSTGDFNSFRNAFGSIASALSFFVFFAVAFAVGSLPQIIVLALPVMYYVSNGLESDAKRGWIFYILAGAIIGGLPWIVYEQFLIGPGRDFESRAVFIVPGLISGILAGAILKARLMKLSRHHHVPMPMPSQTGST
jgi:hypothetical protein